MQSVWRHSLRTFTTKGVEIAAGLAISILVTRTLGPQGRGDYVLIQLLVVTTAMICNPAIYAGANYFLSTGRWSSAQGFGTVLCMSPASGLLGAFLLPVMLSLLNIPAYIAGDLMLMATAAVLTGWIVMSSSLSGLFYGSRRINVITQWKIWFSILQLGCFLGLAVVAGTFQWFIFGYALLTLIDVVVLLALFAHLEAAKPHTSWQSCKELFAYSGPVYLSRIFSFLGQRADMLLVFYLLNTTSLGVYSIAVNIAEQLWLLPVAISMVMMPNLGKLNLTEASETTSSVIRYATLLTLLVLTGFAVSSPWLIPFLYGAEYISSIQPFLLLLPGVAAIGLFLIIEPYFQSRGWPHIPLVITIAGLVLNVFLDFLLIPPYGLNGAATASSIAYLIQFLMAIWLFSIKSRGSFWSPLRIDSALRDGYRYLQKPVRSLKP